MDGRDVPAYAVETEPGDLLVFDQNIKHAAFGGGTRRRMFTLNFTPHYRDEDLGQLRELVSAQARFWIERNYGETLLATAGPARMRHLEQILANEDHLPELARQARERMPEPSRH